MLQGKRVLLLSVSLLVFTVFIACGPVGNPPPPKWTTENPVGSVRGSREASQGTSQGPSQGVSRETTREASTPSSLEALRKGESAATPASSPLKEIYFEFDQHNLRADARETLKANAAWLKANPSARVQIEGHCDERGTDEYNLALGARRAQAAKDYLVELGIAAGRLSTISYGEEIPVCREQAEACWQKNRRDRFVIIPARPGS